MCGYRAPKLDIVRVGFIGIGNRGYANLNQMTFLEGVQIKAVCDIVPFRIDNVQQLLRKQGLPEVQVYTGREDAKKRLVYSPKKL
ncbi:Glycosyl hydrolase family 109 protein 1 [bioreactor metagenome]|uniref:Glycosyl hydrolase family 109 protein 1 n=1 Tax=bioreactor metagenome TaxID=1076179 RepID=A0A645GPC3_9ZZZZ